MSLEVRRLWAVYKPDVTGDSEPDLYYERAQADANATFRDVFLPGHAYVGVVEEVVAVVLDDGRALVLGRVSDARQVGVELVALSGGARPSAESSDAVLRGVGCDHCGSHVYSNCACRRCSREPTEDEKFRACRTHRVEVSTAHERVRGLPAVWV